MEWITCDNTYDECWRRLLEYSNEDLAIEAIEKRHGKADNKTLPNYRKQATQIRVSLLQAKEYFDAAKESSLFTRPNHLYYGLVSLASATMLLNGDGTKALDYLRQDNMNAHHGLDFSFCSDFKRARAGVTLLESSHIKICTNGHFANWYSTIKSKYKMYALKTIHYKSGLALNLEPVGNLDLKSFDDLEKKYSILDLTKRLPDLITELNRYGVLVNHARGEHTVHDFSADNTSQHIFLFHGAPSHEALMKVVARFNCEAGVLFEIDIQSGSTIGAIKTRRGVNWHFSYPDLRETIDHRVIFFEHPIYTPEIVDLYLIGYALSMLSRYFPDIWISFLESHCKGASLVDRLSYLLMMKAPYLMLNQMSLDDLIVSTHRPPWH